MNKLSEIFTGRNAFAASLLVAALLLALLAPHSAVNVDEQLHYPHAQKVVNWYFTGGADKACLETPVTNLKYYGQSVDNFTALINRVFGVEDEFLLRHYTGAFFFLMLLLFSGILGYHLTGSYWVSALTVVSMLAMPRLFGQAFGNLKDIPFAAGYIAGIYFISRLVHELPRPSWKTVVALGFAIAFTNSVRIGGLILFGFLGVAIAAAFLLKPFLLKQIFTTKSDFGRLLGQMLVIVLTGYFAGLLFWPFALQNVFVHPLESLRVMEHYKVSIRQVFEGNWLWSTQLPWFYLPKWLLISTPDFLISGFVVFSAFLIDQLKTKKKQLFTELFLLFAVLFPLVYVVIIGANLYSGIRQMLFVIPLIAIFSSAGFVSLFQTLKGEKLKIAVSVVFAGLIALPVKHQFDTFPADYIYFNSISGGNKKAWSNYEYDYYFHGMKAAAEYLVQTTGAEKITVASNCNLSNYFENSRNITFKYVRFLERSSADWDYGLFGVNYIHPELLKSGKWQPAGVVKTISHKENPLVVVVKRADKTDFQGIELAASGDWVQSSVLLENALQTDKNNVWIILQLAKNSLKLNDFERFNSYLQQGRSIYADYEPFYLLEAQYLFNLGKTEEAKVVLNKLIDVNSRYQNAAPLLKAVNKKLEEHKFNN